MKQLIARELAACNGGPGKTAHELAITLGVPEAVVRNDLARLVFNDQEVTCDREGRYKLGRPDTLLMVRAR